MAIFLAKKILSSSVGLQFISAQIIASIIFAVLYYIQDNVIYNYTDLSAKIGLINDDFKIEDHNHNNLLYWIWLSVIIQSTVGNNLPFSTKGNNIYPIINILQLTSIFGITAYYV